MQQQYAVLAYSHATQIFQLLLAASPGRSCPVGVGDSQSLPQRQFTYYPRLTAMSSMYPDEADASQATFSLVLHRPQSFSLLEDIGKLCARYLGELCK